MLFWLIASAIFVIPFWRIFERAGIAGAWSLLWLLPGIGWVVVPALLGLRRWQQAR
jgi:hypothetical protein